MMVALRASIVLVALLFVASPAWAADGEFAITSSLPVTVEGDHSASSAEGAFLLRGDTGRVSLMLQGDGELERIIHRAYASIRSDDPDAGLLWNQKVETKTVPLTDTILTLAERRDDFTLLAFDGAASMQRGAHDVPLHLGALSSPLGIASEAPAPIRIVLGADDARPFHYTLSSGSYEARSTSGLTTFTGTFELYLADAVVSFWDGGEKLVRAHFREEQHPGAIYDPVAARWTGPGTHTEYVHEYVRLTIDGTLQVQFTDIPATLFADAPFIATLGTALFPDATGTVTIEDGDETRSHQLAGEDLEMAGRFAFRMDGIDRSRTQTSVTGSGDITQVTYASESHAYDWTAVAAAGIGALLLAAIAWFSGLGKWLVGATGAGGAIAGYARVHGEEILEHPGRMEVYERVKAEPGMHFMDLCQRLTFGASTLNYHLRVLERNGYVSRVKDGRYVRFFDQKSGQYSSGRKTAASTLRNQTTAAIAGHIIRHPGIAQRDLAKVFGIAASTVSWHVQRLQREGLIEKERDHHFTRYYMGDAWTILPDTELARVGIVS